MKRTFLLLGLVLLLIGSLSGCMKKAPEEETPPQSQENPAAPESQETQLNIDLLRVELSRSGLDTATLADAVKRLPEILQELFAECGEIEIDRISVTVGASPADTTQALAVGNVDLAFLPMEEYLLSEEETRLLYADAYETDKGVYCAGTRALICAAPTAYGEQLVQRVSSGKPLSWNELAHARWGVLGSSSLGGYRCLQLWLMDSYEGKTISELRQVYQYDSYEELFRAAAAGEIDVISVGDDVRSSVEEAWILDESRTDVSGMRGFGRTASVWEELPVLDATERLYSAAVAARTDSAELSDQRFAAVLKLVLERMAEEEPDLMLSLGAKHFDVVTEENVAPMRRLLAQEAE